MYLFSRGGASWLVVDGVGLLGAGGGDWRGGGF